MMEKKYRITDESVVVNGKTLYRIEALKDFGDVKKGDKGGFIEKEYNLSQKDNCWVYDNAKVYGNAEVHNNTVISDNAKVYGNAEVHNNTVISGNAEVYGNA